MKKILGALLVTAIMGTILVGCGGNSDISAEAAQSTVFKVAHVASESTPVAQGLAKFADLVKEKTNGKYMIEVNNNGKLGADERDYVLDCQLGKYDMAVTNQSSLLTMINDMYVVDLPYVIQSYDHADKIFMGELGKHYKQEVKDNIGVQALSIWEEGFRNLSNSKKAVNTVEDIKGLKIRSNGVVHEEFLETLGAEPVFMKTWDKAYTALQQKEIDGQDCPLSVMLVNNVAKVNNQLAITEHVYSSVFLVMNDKAWSSLDENTQKIFMECAEEAGLYERKVQRKMSEEAKTKLEEQGMKISYPDKQKLIDATKGMKEKNVERFGDVMKKIESAAK